MSTAGTFEDYLASLGRLSAYIDPTIDTPDTVEIRSATADLATLEISVDAVAWWVRHHPEWVPVLGLTVGLSQEKLKNSLRDAFGSSGWVTLAKTQPGAVAAWFESEFGLLNLLSRQLNRTYDFSDVLVARAGSRVTATSAGASGRRVEDEIEAIARDLGLPYVTRTRFTGRNGQTAPADLIVPNIQDADIVVAAKGFDSTGSKLTDAFREIEEMAAVRRPTQFVMAVIDGIGWKSRQADLRRIHGLWATNQIDGMYTLANLDQFRTDLRQAARLRHLI